MQYKSVSDLNRDMIALATSIANDFDLIVGVPRSGMLPATLLALHMHLPLADYDGYLAGQVFGGGLRTQTMSANLSGRPRRVLVVDDSVSTGRAIVEARSKLPGDWPDEVSFAAPYVDAGAEQLVDIYHSVLPQPRVFEWNIFHHPVLQESCVDIDGVLCPDPSEEQNDDGTKYLDFIANVQPRVVPSVRIGHIVSSRTEAYRAPTEAWLARNGIRYGKLHLYPGTAEERRRRQDHATFKSRIYEMTKARLFVESDYSQGRTICRASGKPVFVADEARMLSGGLTYSAIQYGKRRSRSTLRRIKGLLRKIRQAIRAE